MNIAAGVGGRWIKCLDPGWRKMGVIISQITNF
jgi:hypothetical protein